MRRMRRMIWGRADDFGDYGYFGEGASRLADLGVIFWVRPALDKYMQLRTSPRFVSDLL